MWLKKRPNQLGTFLSDCELAWMKGGKGCYLFHHVWHGFDRETERGKTVHPSQKPVALMMWCLERLRLPAGSTVFDPYMGCGATGIAALELGLHFVGCEIEPTYFEIARQRLTEGGAGAQVGIQVSSESFSPDLAGLSGLMVSLACRSIRMS